jgi:two-component system sensor histidine kinase UhpB
VNAYFNTRQVESVQDIADILAFSLMVINLVETMQELSRQVLYEKELQRQRIATEIHNEPLHTLTTVMMQLREGASDEAIRDAARTIRRVTRDLRRIIAGLRPPVLKDSVEWMTRQLVREFDETHDDICVSLDLAIRSDKQASEQTKLACYYILTEALNNVSKHAQATSVAEKLYYGEDRLTLEVRDNGVGAEVATRPLTELLRGHHIGVADMHRWASIGGGTLEIGENVPSGTAVLLALPVTIYNTSGATISG